MRRNNQEYPLLRIYNSMSRSMEEFRPANKDRVKIFTCGPSIYQHAHLGNYRTFLYEDLLVRYLLFSGFGVERAMNLTDIEDKTISEANRKKTDYKSLTDDVLAVFRNSLEGFGFIMPEHLIPATESIEQSVRIIQKLVEKGYAYSHNGDYFFDPLKKKDFGRLFRLDMSSWPKQKRRFRKDTYNGNRWNRGDFILWHAHKSEQGMPFWDTELGPGRPSWNIQDPAIITMSLGNQIDINCGGIDNIYRHHDYNIAVTEAYTGIPMAFYYMHGEHLTVNGKSMSKSRGNIIYPEDLVSEGYTWKEIRFFLSSTHYRKKLNFTAGNMEDAAARLRAFRSELNRLSKPAADASSITEQIETEAEQLIDRIVPVFTEELDNDLALGNGFSRVYGILESITAVLNGQSLPERLIKKLEYMTIKIDNVLNVIYPSPRSS